MSKRSSGTLNSSPRSHKKQKTNSSVDMDSSLHSTNRTSITPMDPGHPGSFNLKQPSYSAVMSTSTPLNLNSGWPVSPQYSHLNSQSTSSLNSRSPTGLGDGNGWTKVEKRKEKKAKKNSTKATNQPPGFAFNIQELVKMRTVTISDIRELVLHLTGDAQSPPWLRVTNRTSIQRIVVLLVPGITVDVFTPPLQPGKNTANPLLHVPIVGSASSSIINKANVALNSRLPFLSTFLHAVPTKAPGDQHRMHSVLHGFFMGPVTGEEKKRRIAERVKSERQTASNVSDFLLTKDQLIENEYPLPSWLSEVSQLDDDWLQTPEYREGDEFSADPRVLALDCEMCVTTAGKELAHICIIDYHTSDKLYDKIVVPSAPIIDYLTRWSGLSLSSFENATTTLSDVHTYLRSLITPSTILVGHSLESDLKAMKLAHSRCIDTSIIYHHPRGRPLKPGLKWLMNKWFDKEIQNRGEGGHDPEEDARACAELLKAKMKNGPSFGHFQVDIENILERMGRAAAQSQSSSNGVRTAVVDYGTPSTWLGSKATSTVACTNDDDVVNGIEDLIGTHQFIFGRMMELSEALGWSVKKPSLSTILPSTPATGNTTEPTFPPASPAPEESMEAGTTPSKPVEEVFQCLNDNLTRLHRSLPPSTAFILFSGHGDPKKMAELNRKRYVWETAIKEGKTLKDIPKEDQWSAADERLLEDEVAKAKLGLLFLGIKQ